MKTHYEILGISRDADLKTIKSSYRKLVKKYHPDVNKDKSSKASKYFETITAAYNTLIHPDKRRAYDSRLDGRHEGSSFYVFPFRELGKWISTFNIYRMLFSEKNVSKNTSETDPAVLNLTQDELLQRILYSKNRHVQIHAVRVLLLKTERHVYLDLLRLLYTGIHEEVKMEILSGFRTIDKTGMEKVLREIYRIEKSIRVKNAIKACIRV